MNCTFIQILIFLIIISFHSQNIHRYIFLFNSNITIIPKYIKSYLKKKKNKNKRLTKIVPVLFSILQRSYTEIKNEFSRIERVFNFEKQRYIRKRYAIKMILYDTTNTISSSIEQRIEDSQY